MKILIMNGINLCMLGTREPEKYGNRTLEDILADVSAWAKTKENLELVLDRILNDERIQKVEE